MAGSAFVETVRQAAAVAEQPMCGRTIPRKVMLIVALGTALLYATQVNGRWRPSFDDAHYLILGRSLAAGDGYRMNGQIDSALPPGLPLVLAGVFAAVGDNFFVFQAIMAVFGLGALACIHACLKRVTDPATAFVVTVLTGLSYWFYSSTGKILTDVPTTMLLWLTIYTCMRFFGGRRAWLALALAISVSAVLFRAAGVLMMGALGVGMVLDGSLHESRRRRLAAAVAVVAPALATTMVLYLLARQAGSGGVRYESTLRDALGVHHNPIVSYGLQLAALLGELPRTLGSTLTGQQFWAYGLVMIALITLGMAASAARRRGLAPAMCILYPLGLILALKTRYVVHPRMWLPIQPLLLLLALRGLAFLCALATKGARRDQTMAAGRKAAVAFVAVVVAVTLGASIPRIVGEAFLNTYYHASRQYYSKMSMPQVGAFLAMAEKAAEMDGLQKAVLVYSPTDAEVMGYVSRRLTAQWPLRDESSDEVLLDCALTTHRHATENRRISTVLVPLKYRIPPVLAREARRAFDDDPAWRLVLSNEYYALYQRADAMPGYSDANAVGR